MIGRAALIVAAATSPALCSARGGLVGASPEARPDETAIVSGPAQVEPKAATTTQTLEHARNPPRDPPGMRGFESPYGHLPNAPAPAAYDPPGAPCPVDMALVEGKLCARPVQDCLRWLDPDEKPPRSCAEFVAPVRCAGPESTMRFCIDRYEFTPHGYRFPLVNVSWNEAQVLCGAMDKRLCEEDEWVFACEGPESRPYPHGFMRDGAACNYDVDGALFMSSGKLIDRRVAADALPRCKSPFGVYNLVGNVDEWTTRPENQEPRRSILHGGWWLNGRNRCRAATDSHAEFYFGPQSGFRCCKPAR